MRLYHDLRTIHANRKKPPHTAWGFESGVTITHIIVRPGDALWQQGWRPDRCYITETPLRYRDRLHGQLHEAPAYFMFDGVTGPMWHIWDHPYGQFVEAACIHDWYLKKAASIRAKGEADDDAVLIHEAQSIRHEADLLMPEMVEWLDGETWKQYTAFVAVRANSIIQGY